MIKTGYYRGFNTYLGFTTSGVYNENLMSKRERECRLNSLGAIVPDKYQLSFL